MKRIYFALFIAATLLSACDKKRISTETVIPSEKESLEYTFNFNVGKDSEDGTKAVKQSWADNDMVRVFFSGLTTGYLELTYQSGEWGVEEKGITGAEVAALETQKCAAVWIDGNVEPQYSSNAWQFAQGGEMLIATDVDFAVAEKVISASLSLRQHSEFTKVTVTGLAGANWTLQPKAEWGIAARAGSIALASDCKSSAAQASAAEYKGIECSEGVYFFVVPVSVERTSFKISNGSAKYVSTFGNDLSTLQGKALKIKGLSDGTWLQTNDVLYIQGSTATYVNGTPLADWTVTDPVEIPLADGKYTFIVSHFANFVMGSQKGSWSVWDKNKICPPKETTKAGVPTVTLKGAAAKGKTYNSDATTAGNRIVWDGTFIVEVTENFDLVTITPKYIYIAGSSTTKVNGNSLPNWVINPPVAVEIADGKYHFTVETAADNSNIDLGSTNPLGNWNSWNVCKFSPSPKNFNDGTLTLVVNKDGWFFNKAGKYDVVINNTLTTAVVTKL